MKNPCACQLWVMIHVIGITRFMTVLTNCWWWIVVDSIRPCLMWAITHDEWEVISSYPLWIGYDGTYSLLSLVSHGSRLRSRRIRCISFVGYSWLYLHASEDDCMTIHRVVPCHVSAHRWGEGISYPLYTVLTRYWWCGEWWIMTIREYIISYANWCVNVGTR